MRCSEGHMENCVLVSCAPLYHHRDVQPQGSVWPTACNQCMSTTRQGTCDASHWPSCHRWTATCMLLPERSSLTLFISVHGLLVALERPKATLHNKATKRIKKRANTLCTVAGFTCMSFAQVHRPPRTFTEYRKSKKILLGTAVRNMRSSN